jgi:uncharacterized protein with HEPN domain
MSRDRLMDIVRAANTIQRYATGLDAAAMQNAEIVRDATLLQFAVIGEAVCHLPAQIQALAPDVPWAEIRATRHYIIHGYWQIDDQAIVSAIDRDLPPLKVAANQLIGLIEHTNS